MEFAWSAEKEERLKAVRGVSFEEVQTAIEEGGLMYVVLMRDSAWVVPFHEDDDTIVLHTAFPDRRMMRKYGFR